MDSRTAGERTSTANTRLSNFWHSEFISYRRYWLDYCLGDSAYLMHGVVLDIGGKKERKRGTFVPPKDGTSQWWYINLDVETCPDTIADVTCVPMIDACADCVICTEVLEHLSQPANCIAEVFRLLKPGGVLIASVPFLYPVHADPFDYQRFTADGLRALCLQFSSVTVENMGGYLGTIGMLIEQGTTVISGWRVVRGAVRRTIVGLARTMCWFDFRYSRYQSGDWDRFTTGFFVIAIK